jgi:hypothetical protein
LAQLLTGIYDFFLNNIVVSFLLHPSIHRLLVAPFGLSSSAINVLGKDDATEVYSTIYRQWEDLLSRRIYAAKGIPDDRVAASMHQYVEVKKDVQVVFNRRAQ